MDKVKEILAKESLNGDDVNFLMANQSLLSQNDLVRLGLAPASPVLVVEEPVKQVEAPNVEAPAVVPPKKRGPKAKKK